MLEVALYETFIQTSESFQQLMNMLIFTLDTENVYNWGEKEDVRNFFSFLAEIFTVKDSLLNVVEMLSLMMRAHKAQITWLDETAEALKNCSNGLETYILFSKNNAPPSHHENEMSFMDSGFLKIIEQS